MQLENVGKTMFGPMTKKLRPDRLDHEHQAGRLLHIEQVKRAPFLLTDKQQMEVDKVFADIKLPDGHGARISGPCKYRSTLKGALWLLVVVASIFF